MRIAYVGPFGFHPNKTMRSRALRLATAWQQRGHTTALFMPPWQTPDEAGRQWEENGVSIAYTRVTGGTLGITRALLRATLAFEPDIVHCFKPKAYSGLVAWWLWQTRRQQLRLVVDTDDWEGWGGWNDKADYSPLQKRFFNWQEQWGLRHAHAVTVASRALETLAWSVGGPSERVAYVPNGAGIGSDIGGASARRKALGLANRPVLLLYSRLFEFDIDRLVAVLQRVHAAVPDLAILAVGAGLFADDAADLRAQLQTNGLLDAFVDVGWLDEADLPATLAAADVGLYLIDDTLLNRTKCPVKLVDMLTCGVPVVAEAVGQVPAYIDHQREGWLVPSGDVDAVVDGLVRLLQDDTRRQQLATQARERALTEFNWQTLAARLAPAYGL